MKTAGKGTARKRVAFRAHGAEGKNNPAQLHGLEDKKTSGPRVRYFLLTSPLIEHGLEDKKTSGPRVRYFLLTSPLIELCRKHPPEETPRFRTEPRRDGSKIDFFRSS